MMTVLCSSALAILLTAIQLLADYRGDRDALFRSVHSVEATILPGLVQSLRLRDKALVRAQLEGIVQIGDVSYAEIEEGGTLSVSAGTRPVGGASRVEFALVHEEAGSPIPLGTLRVFLNLDQIYSRLMVRGAIILTTNLLKTFLVAGFVLFLYQRLVGRHLLHLADFARGYDPEKSPVTLTLDRPPQIRKDELAELETALNFWVTAQEVHAGRLRNASEDINRKNAELRQRQMALVAGNVRLERANRQLREANREQAEFTYAISHDLKSPTNTLRMLIEELQDLLPADAEAGEVLSDMKSTNTRMGQLIEDVLKYSRIVEERFKREPVDLDAIVDEVLEDLAGEVQSASVAVWKEPLPVIEGHPLQLRILFQNIIGNAIKFRKRGRTPMIRITAHHRTDGRIAIAVADNGIGIPEAHREKVFGLFNRLHSSAAYAGSGLGLAICKRVMSHHQGDITIHGGIDGGTTFQLLFQREKHHDRPKDQARTAD